LYGNKKAASVPKGRGERRRREVKEVFLLLPSSSSLAD